MNLMKGLLCVLVGVMSMSVANAQTQLGEVTIGGWSMQDVVKMSQIRGFVTSYKPEDGTRRRCRGRC